MRVRGVTIVLGPACSGKTTLLVEQYVRFLKNWQQDCLQPSGIWIGPSQGAVGSVRDLLAKKSQSSLLNPQIATFARFAEQVIARGRRRIRPIGPWEKLRILQQLVASLLGQKKLTYYAAVAHTPGFVRQVAQFIGELKRRDIWAEQFCERARTDRDRDFGATYSAYQHFLATQDLYDAEGRFWAAREELQTESESRWGLVVVDGFTDFTAAQHDILGLMAERSERMLISLLAEAEQSPSSPGRELLFGRAADTRQMLRASLPDVQAEYVRPSRFESAGIAHVERQLFRDDQTLSGQAAGLSILAANSVQGEIQEIARRVKTLLLSDAVRPEEIAVVFRNFDEVAPRITDVCDDFGLPFWLETRSTLVQSSLVRSLLKLLRLHEQDWPFDSLVDFVGVAAMQRIAGNMGTRSDWRVAAERSLRRAQLPAGRTLLIEQLRLWADGGEEPSPESRDAAVALSFFESLDRLLSALPLRATLGKWIGELHRIVESLAIPDSEKHWESLRHTLNVLVANDEQLGVADDELTVTQVLHLVEQVAAEVPLSAKIDAVGRVRFLSATSARTLTVRHLFLAGLGEQSYSSGESSARLYSQQEVGKFTPDSQSQGTTPEEQAGDAMLLFYEMVTRASETLTLSYSALDEKGQALSPSPFLTELERCFAPGVIPRVTMSVGETASEGRNPLSRSDWRLAGMGAALEGDAKWLAGLAMQEVGQAILDGVACVGSRSKRESFGPYEGILASESVRAALAERFNEEHLWSPSRLETYAACPFRFFAGQLLRLEPLDGIALRSDHLRRGTLLHQVLAAVHQSSGDPPTDASEAELVARFGAALERLIAESPLSGLNDALREIERREVLAWAPQYAEQEIKYRQKWNSFEEPMRPAHFEVRFGPRKYDGGEEGQDPLSQAVPFTLDLESEQIKLTGQIDRIDMGQVRGVSVFAVIDYKSGQGVKVSPKEMEAGRQLQLPLYALAAEKLLLADQQALALTTGYWNIKGTGFAGGREGPLELRTATDAGLQDSASWQSLQEAILARVEEVIHGVRAGEFPVYNENLECTASCDFSKICRVAQIRSLEKVWPHD